MALLLSLATASLFGAEIRVDQPLTPPVFGPAPARQESARVASDGSNFFAVWRTRSATNAVVIGAGRISPAGELLDRPSILIASGTGLGNLDVVFVGGNYLVVYQSGTSVVARRVSREGRLVDQQPVVLNNTGMSGQLATNGDTVLLLTSWKTFRMLAADGTPLRPNVVIPNAGIYTPSVTSNGSQYLIAYASDYSSGGSFTILNPSGNVVRSNELPIPEPFYINSLSVASNGSSFLMALAIDGRIGCMVVDAAGNTGPLRKTDNQSGGAIVATWSGSDYTLAWAIPKPPDISGLGRILGMRVDAAGLPLDTTPVPITTSQYSYASAIASNGRDTIIITTGDLSSPDWRTSAAIFKSLPQIDAEPEGRRHAAIASSAAEQTGGSIASNGTLSLVTWRERAGFETVVRAAFIAADGQLGAPMELGEANSQTGTATASNGRDFLVVYYDKGYELIARRVTLEGVDPTPIVITIYGTPTDALAAAWSGQAYVVVTSGYSVATISGISPNGIVTVPRQVLNSSAPGDTPVVECGAGGCNVAWHTLTPWDGTATFFPIENDVLVITDLAGTVVSRVLITDAMSVTPARAFPRVDGGAMFIYSSGRSMFAGRVTAAGVVLDTPAVNGGRRVMTSETSFALQPAAVVNSGLYFVEPDDYTSGRLYWTRIEPEPAPHVTSLVNLHESVTLPVTLTASRRNTYLVYSRGEDDATLMAPRLFLRTLASPDPQPSPIRRHATR